MILTDTHTHLYVDAFDEDRNQLIEEAISKGIKRFFLPAIDSNTTQSMIDLQSAFPENVFLMNGLHPTHVDENWPAEVDLVKQSIVTNKIVAIGEIGIDLYWEKEKLDLQIAAFKSQIELSLEHDLPIVIHCRDAFDEVFEVLESFSKTSLRGIFHCFTGDLQQARRAVDLSMHLGIGGVVTFKNGGLDKFLNEIPLENIVLETDAPYLAPAPYRGKRNKPVYLLEVANKVAHIYDLPVEEVARVTTENSRLIFGI